MFPLLAEPSFLTVVFRASLCSPESPQLSENVFPDTHELFVSWGHTLISTVCPVSGTQYELFVEKKKSKETEPCYLSPLLISYSHD